MATIDSPSNYNNEMGAVLKSSINGLAAKFYRMQGKKQAENFDFSAPTHPEEFACWNMSCVAHAYIKAENAYLGYQVTNKIELG